MSEEKLTVGKAVKTAVFTVLAIAGFFVLWGVTFLLSLPFTLNLGLSIPLSFIISAVTTIALVTSLTETRIHLVLSKRQKIAAFVAFAVIVVLSLPLIIIDFPLFLCLVPTLLFVLVVVAYYTSKRSGA